MNTLRIRKVGIISAGKIYAAMSFVVGLLLGLVYGLFIIVFSLISGAAAGSRDGLAGVTVGGGGILMGIFIIISFPLIYACFGFLGGVIGALIYNLFAGIVGGIEIEVENIN